MRVCPQIVPYTAEDQARALRELDLLPPGSTLERFTNDYGDLRARLRAACQST